MVEEAPSGAGHLRDTIFNRLNPPLSTPPPPRLFRQWQHPRFLCSVAPNHLRASRMLPFGCSNPICTTTQFRDMQRKERNSQLNSLLGFHPTQLLQRNRLCDYTSSLNLQAPKLADSSGVRCHSENSVTNYCSMSLILRERHRTMLLYAKSWRRMRGEMSMCNRDPPELLSSTGSQCRSCQHPFPLSI